MSISLDTPQLVALTGATKVEGEYLGKVRSLASLAEAGPEDLSFLGNPKYVTEVPTSRASVILVPGDYAGQPAAGQAFLRVAKPSYALALVCSAIEAQLWPKPAAGIHATAVVDATAVIDASSTSGAITWNFSSGSEAFDFLAAGETLVLTYVVKVTDGNSADDDTQTVTITITGTNDGANSKAGYTIQYTRT